MPAAMRPAPEPDLLLETTLSLCPVCGALLPAQVVARQGRVLLRKQCPEHGPFEALTFADADLYQRIQPYNKPGLQPRAYSAPVQAGCPWDCGLCPEHRQHLCLGVIEVTSDCNLACPVCFADAGARREDRFQLDWAQVNAMLDRFRETEAQPEVIQFSGGEPTLHPQILEFLALAVDKGFSYVMLNTNGLRLARDDRFLQALARLQPHIYLQFDGFDSATNRQLRGRSDLVQEKLRALDRLGEAGLRAVLVAVIERGVNEHEIGPIVEFGLRHPAVFGVSFQSAFHSQRHLPFDPLQRVTTPDILAELEAQTHGLFRLTDFIPVPCCMPTCGFTTYALLSETGVLPIPRVVPVDLYLDYLTNRTMPDLDTALLQLLENLWTASAQVGTNATAAAILQAVTAAEVPLQTGWTAQRCASCRVGQPLSSHAPRDLAKHVFMISTRDFMDAWTFNVRDVHKCCVGVLVPDGRIIPFCAYNACGYRQQVARGLAQAVPVVTP